MAEVNELSPGDMVIHPRRPEWGEGVVNSTMKIHHQGRPAQRVIVSFAHRNKVTINTAVAPLIAKESYQAMSSTPSTATTASPSDGGWLGSLAQRTTERSEHELWRLAEPLTDPFSSLNHRLQATLDSFRFSTEPRRLTAWATAQTGMHDPLTKYTRQELEQAFGRYAHARESHLQDLVRQLKRQNQKRFLNQAIQAAREPGAREAIKRAMRN